MASGNGNNSVRVENTERTLQEKTVTSDIEGEQNGDIYMDMGTEMGETTQNIQNGHWNTVRHKKRRRQNTGSVDLEHFDNLNRDEQLSAIFAKLIIFEQTQNKMNTLEGQVRNNTQRVSEVEGHTDVNAHRIKMLAYKQLDIETNMRRNNLIFRGLNEERGESTYDIIYRFLSEQLNIDIEEVSIVDAYRLGSYKSALNRVARSGNDIRRPVLVTFRYPGDADGVISLAYMLKGSRFSIDKDYPSEIAAARRRLWPDFKHLRANNPQSKVVLKYPARVEVNGNTVVDLFPEWGDLISGRSREWGDLMSGRSDIHVNYRAPQVTAQSQQSASVSVDPNQPLYDADTESGEEFVRPTHQFDTTVESCNQQEIVNRQESAKQTNSSLPKAQLNHNIYTESYNDQRQRDIYVQNRSDNAKQQQTNNNKPSQNVNNNTLADKTSSVKGAPVANESPGIQSNMTPIVRDNTPRT